MPDETQKERIDRELIELLNELRVALPGVQVLFGFLLAIPFANRFARVTGLTEAMYVVALMATAVASALLIAPSAVHRMRFRNPNKEEILLISHRLAIAGLVALAVAISAAVYVVIAFLHGSSAGAAAGAGVAALLAFLWFVLPRLRWAAWTSSASS